MPRSALIVDDSRTALAALSRLLKAQGMAVDTVESGPEALDYLHHNAPPGVIFLDHMMPGMDGFETLKALKADAQTADTPVIMYTSREGENYIGQALVQGALGVLSKPVDPDRLTEILQQVDRLRGAARPAGYDRRATPRAANTGVIGLSAELRPPAVPAREIKPPAAEPVRPSSLPTGIPHRARTNWLGRVGRGVLVLLLLLPAVWLYQRDRQAERQRSGLAQENSRLQAELEQLRARAAADAVSRPVATPESTAPRTPPENRALYDTLAWALSRAGQYGPDEEPFDDARLALVRDLVARLAAGGFRGSVRLESHVGEFCLARDDQGEYRLPDESLSFQACEVVTYPPAQAVMLGQRQSAAFTRYLAERRNAAIGVTVVSHGSSRPLAPYPEASVPRTAGEWNRVARRNQRVEIVLIPAPTEN